MSFAAGADPLKIDAAMRKIMANGGRVNRKDRSFSMPKNPGLKMWAWSDCLINWAGFQRLTAEAMSGREAVDPIAATLAHISARNRKREKKEENVEKKPRRSKAAE